MLKKRSLVSNKLCTLIKLHCILTENTGDNQKCMLFIESVLKAMKYGSKKASELFPIILQFENLSDFSLRETFISEVFSTI